LKEHSDQEENEAYNILVAKYQEVEPNDNTEIVRKKISAPTARKRKLK
jgi:hypothetical protein